MAAAYDTFDYPSYWEEREYEHESEVVAIKAFLEKIPKVKNVLEIGCGFGRLVASYSFRAKKIILSDPSAKLLKMARKSQKGKNTEFIQSTVENLPKKIRSSSVDLIVCVRVAHHLKNLDSAFASASKFLKKGGYFIFEFANKSHLKATLKEFLKGNFTFPIDIFPKDIRTKKSKGKKSLPFLNYHPDIVKEKLEKHGFEIIEARSVSNIRSPFIKRHVQTEILLSLEEKLQKPLSYINFGPSVFVLAKKK